MTEADSQTPRRCASRAGAWALMAALCTTAAQAHDTWVMPQRFVLTEGEAVSAQVSSGDGLKPVVAPTRRALRTLQLVHAGGRGDARRWQRLDKHAQAEFAAPAPGLACLVHGMDDTEIRLEADTVAAYLQEIAAPRTAVAAWQQQQSRGQPWAERYAKDGKTYLRSGTAQAGWPALQRLGHRLELVPQSDPTRLKVGDPLALTLLHEGRTLPDVAVRLAVPGAPEQVQRSDAQGQVVFKLTQAGAQLLATTVLTPPATPGVAWQSRFATLGLWVDPR